MNESLDKILSERGEAVPEQKPAVETQPNIEQAAPDPDVIDADEPQTDANGQRMVPQQALHASKKRYTEVVADFDKRMAESNAAWERRMAQLVDAVKPKQEQQQIPDWFENPEQRTDYQVDQRTAPRFQQVDQQVLFLAKENAEIRFSEEKVQEAEQAFIQAMQTQQLDPADYHKVVGSPNRYAAAVQWHQRQIAQQEIGDDPTAFRAKVEAEILAKHGLAPEQPGNGQQRNPAAVKPGNAPVMPHNLATARNVGARTGPAWNGPPDIADIFNRRRNPGT